jgi:hypothetical protein
MACAPVVVKENLTSPVFCVQNVLRKRVIMSCVSQHFCWEIAGLRHSGFIVEKLLGYDIQGLLLRKCWVTTFRVYCWEIAGL